MEKKYKIRIECRDDEDARRFDEQLPDGVECDGFMLIAQDDESKAKVLLHDLTILDMACMFVSHSELMEAAIIAKGLLEAKQHKEKTDGNNLHKLLELLT